MTAAKGADDARGAGAAATAEAGTPLDPWAPPADVQPADAPPADVPPVYAPPVYAPPAPYGTWAGLPPQPAPPVNGFAVAALVTGLTCLLWPLALAFGVTGLVQIPSRRQRGRGMAIAGVLLSAVGMLLSLGLIGSVGSSTVGMRAVAGVPDYTSLQVGECFDRVGSRFRQTACSAGHDAEVVGSTQLTGSTFPGQTERERQLGPLCRQLANGYAMDNWVVWDSVLVNYYAPLEGSWSAGERTAVCFLTSSAGKLTGSLRKDETNTTQAQYSYLRAMDAIDRTASNRPTATVADDPAGYREWAGTMADVLKAQTAALDDVTWDAAVKPAVAAQVAELRLRAASLRAAADPGSADELRQDIADGDRHRGYAQQKAVRQLLGLSTDDSWLHRQPKGDGAPLSV